MSEIAPQQLLITLVHGTWPRGFCSTFFPSIVWFKQRVRELTRRQRRDPCPYWFDERSPFLARLSTELGDIPHQVKPLLWSGKNSIFERNRFARVLAEHLSAEHAEHPQATQLVVAHSHGGNIALQALHYLPKQDGCQSDGAKTTNPLVVTLATPFMEIHRADFGHRPGSIRAVVLLAMLQLLQLLFVVLFPAAHSDVPLSTPTEMSGFGTLIFLTVVGLPILTMGFYWISKRTTARENQVDALSRATRLAVTPQRLLVVRAIDDEASLVLALGATLNYVTVKSIMLVYWIMATLAVTVLPAWFLFLLVVQRSPDHYPSWYRDVMELGCSAFIITLFGVFAISRTVHGRELAKSPMECQVNTQSTPDAIGLSKIVTLVRRTYVRSLRHGIYDHEDCAKTISNWVRSQLCALPVK
jgi:hypothetical protein